MGNEKMKETKTNSTKSILRENDRWVVSVKLAGCEEIMDEFYLYTLDFIYGDKKQQEQMGYRYARRKQYIGSDDECKISLSGKGVERLHGTICFEQDFGLLYINEVENVYQRITDGLVINLGEYVLCFKKESPVYKKTKLKGFYDDLDDASDDSGKNLKEIAESGKEELKKTFSKTKFAQFKKKVKEWLGRNF